MKVPYSYLAAHIDLSGVNVHEVADKLTFAGAEVEGIETLASGTNLVIGKIISCINHPDSDHLHILQVDEGEKHGIHQIVCGAPNARKDLKVIVARSGAKLPQIEIKPSLIRGQESDGMCCSLLELGVDRKYLSDAQVNGIEELPEDAPVGEEKVLEYLGLGESILEVSVLPNRPDLYALENVAKEVACLLGKEYHEDEIPSYQEVPTKLSVSSSTPACPLFGGKIYRDIEIKPSPKWMVDILRSCGIRSINNVVDIGNYVMLLTGQPLNMYDLDKMGQEDLHVVDDYEGPFLAMDGNTYELKKGDLLVCSKDTPSCLAGVMTSESCRVDDRSKNIVVEAAYFKASSIRHTSNRIGLMSDSSLRFCKGISPDQSEHVFALVSQLLVTLANAKVIEETALYDQFPHQEKVITTTLGYINSRLGTSFGLDEVVEVLRRDYFKVEVEGEELTLTAPKWRIDIDLAADITEEVIRLKGYENVPALLMEGRVEPQGLSLEQQKERAIRRYLTSQGLNEILTYTLVSPKEIGEFAYLGKGEPLKLLNPITVDHSLMRINLLPSVIASVAYNGARQEHDCPMFEVSDVYSKDGKSKRLAFVLSGNKKGAGRLGETPYSFYDAKGLLEGVLSQLGIKENRYKILPFDLGGNEIHPGRSAKVMIGKDLVGVIGEIHPSCGKALGVKGAILGEIDLGYLFSLRAGQIKASIPPRFPSVKRDLALLVPSSTVYEDLKREIMRADSLIKVAEIFDVYEGEHLPEGKKSIAISLTLSDPEKTLKEEEIVFALNKAINAVKIKFGAEVRQ